MLLEIRDVLHAEIVKRFGQIEQIKPIAVGELNKFNKSTILDPRFKNLHFSDLVAFSNAMAELRRLSKPDMSSNESEGEVTSGDNVESYGFWAHLKMLAQVKIRKNIFHLQMINYLCICQILYLR